MSPEVWLAAMERACLQGSLAIVLVWLLCRLVFRSASPSVRAALWWVAFFKCLLAFAVAVPIAIPVLKPETPPSSPVLIQQTTSGNSPQVIAQAEPDARKAPSLPRVIFFLWLIGAAGMAGWTGYRLARLSSLAKSGSPLDYSPLGEQMRAIGAQMGLDAKPHLVESNKVATPFVVGFWRGTIVLPAQFSTDLSAGELRMMLAHELAHVRRRDSIVGVLPTLCQILFFFLPTLWVALREWSVEREAACDEEALSLTQGSPADYGQMLMRVVTLDHQSGLAADLGATSTYHTLRKRLEMLKTFTSPHRATRSIAIALLACGMLVAIPWQLTARAAQAPHSMQNLPVNGTFTIHCRVVYEDGKPAAGVIVGAYDNDDPKRYDGGFGLSADKNGEVTFNLPMSYLPHLSFRADQGDQFSEPRVFAKQGEVLVRLRKLTLASLSGTVRDSKGNPLAGATVYAIFDGTLPFIGDRDTLSERKTASDGSYRFDGVYPGVPVMIEAKKNGWISATTPEENAIGGRVRKMPDLRLKPGK